MANVRYPSLTPGSPFTDTNNGEKLGLAFTVTAPVTITGFYFSSPVVHAGRSFEIFANEVNVVTMTAAVTVGDNYIPLVTPFDAVPGTGYVMAAGMYGTAVNMQYNATAFASGGTESPFVFPASPGRYDDSGPTSSTFPYNTSPNWYGIGPYVAEEVTDPTIQVSAVASDTSVIEGETVTLTASVVDNNGSVDYEWTQIAGTTTAITNASTSVAQVTPATAGSYTFRVTATDDTDTDTADVTITVTTEPVEPSIPPTLWIKDADGNWFAIGGTSGNSRPGVFHPEDFGAVGDGVTDDTAAWNACVAAAVAAAPDHNYAVTVEALSAEYLIASAPVPGREYGKAQVSIPHVPASTSRKITLTLRGQSIASTFLHWEQEAPHSLGTVLHSTYDAGSYEGTWGVPSILGGPTNLSTAPQDQFATFSNMHIVVDGISTLQPSDASLIGFDFRWIAQAHVVSASSFSDLTRKTTPSISTLVDNDQSVGLVMPYKGNNARSEIGSYTAEGLYTALIASEHLTATYLGVIYCRRGLQINGVTAGSWSDGQRKFGDHSIVILRYLAEAVDYWVYNDTTATQLIISSMGGEGTTNFVAHVYDSISGEGGQGGLSGEIHLLDIFQHDAVVVGNTPLRIVNDQRRPGLAVAPTLPSTTTALRNPFWRDATVAITGGTVTNVSVGGQNYGQVGAVVVPTGASITVSYTGSPSWTWLLH